MDLLRDIGQWWLHFGPVLMDDISAPSRKSLSLSERVPDTLELPVCRNVLSTYPPPAQPALPLRVIVLVTQDLMSLVVPSSLQ